IAGLRVSGIFRAPELDNLRIAVRNDAPALRDILDKAIADISPAERQAIVARWVPLPLVVQAAAPEPAAVALTAAERAWIATHPVVRVAGDRAWPPVEFLGASGEFEGLAVDYLRRIEELTGLRFVFDLDS